MIVYDFLEQLCTSSDFFTLTGLNLEQVDTLWSCLALDKDCSDDCLSWFLNQAKSKDHHAMGLETFKHIFLEKVKLKKNCGIFPQVKTIMQ